ncbi:MULTISPECIES: helix-turn-helix transcriptional regulator [unclassified Mucilaginibacter]|uniref:helix-turn-helix domain-containing protein n=1 Tax=unclassified Mucilaginibacter TaxID=2617802 RepID=UPI002AC98219|nr:MULTISPECIES: helix-turn-helix transcriptional regulator [unclassified Mucilaginibacter]MEB0280818.1 helix-turn-helix transcriptional regulator [Mucilaginibacter sp. 10B2]MEB0302254.1 helix-turn-helix transcriptional regulator [Mucilaginibacter sp. 5C4]WPX25664.1 helix-turn-helix transcriptional regulator [Mucilaginibacter sp. 5C4]
MAEPTLHIGRKISKIRELKGMKQETLASELGISQQAVSKIEQSADVDGEALEKIARILGLSSEAIKAFTEEAIFNIISNTFHNTSSDNSTLIASSLNYQPTFNTVEKIVELYERLLQAEKEKNELLKGK